MEMIAQVPLTQFFQEGVICIMNLVPIEFFYIENVSRCTTLYFFVCFVYMLEFC